MTPLEAGAILVALMLLLLVSGVWIAAAIGLTATVGFMAFSSTPASLNLARAFWETGTAGALASLPLFIWMGEILVRTKLSEQLFSGLAPWLTKVPGRLMHVNVLGCGIFGAVSGSSAATCATVAKIALPELLRRGYDEKTVLGSLTGAGTLGILIPPSIAMVVYAVAAEQNVIRLFLAGIVPGLMLMAFFSAYLMFWAWRNPEKVPIEPDPTWGERLRSLRQLAPVSLLIVSVFTLLLTGIVTANEAAAWGVLGALILAAVSRTLNWQAFIDSIAGAVRLTCMIVFILCAANMLTYVMGFTRIPSTLAEWVTAQQLSPYALVAALTVVYVLLGMALDGVSMIVLTTVVVIPLVQKAGFDLVWFGIYIVLLIEIAQVTPPVGFNLFVIQNMSGRGLIEIARAALPFFFLMLLAVLVIVVWPEITTWLPNRVFGKST
jgi:tripartite ATP-independent transporter DctM subunit